MMLSLSRNIACKPITANLVGLSIRDVRTAEGESGNAIKLSLEILDTTQFYDQRHCRSVTSPGSGDHPACHDLDVY